MDSMQTAGSGIPTADYFKGIFGQIVEAAPNAMLMADLSGRIEMVNAQTELLFGYARTDLLGQKVELLMPERFAEAHARLWPKLAKGAPSGRMARGRDVFARRQDGSEIAVEVGLTQIMTGAGPMVLAAIVDISHRAREAARINAALREKVLLLGEIHHRVKNNLQIVSSLLDLQSARIADPVTLELLRDSQNRIRSMALVHQTLCDSKDFARVDIAAFLGALLSAVADSYASRAGGIRCQVEADPVTLPIDKAVPCGLVVNELISNAFKHAFPDRRPGEIRVALSREEEDEVSLSVSDDGIGLPDHVDPRRTETLGSRLIHVLTRQLAGSITIGRSNPTRFTLRFPAV